MLSRAIRKVFLATLASSFALTVPATAQTSSASPTTDQTAVFRATTELVQTDVTVFDRDGRFVEGLRREDFELRIDNKVRPIQFFERIAVGTAREEAQLAKGSLPSDRDRPSARASLDRGRTMLIYVDDLHLDLGGLNAAQKLIGDFIEEEMSQNDEVAIASASGQIGFLQQLTDNKAVLRRALERIKLRPNSVRDLDRPPMTEYQALLIEKYDRDVTAFFIQETIRNNPGISAAQAENLSTGFSNSSGNSFRRRGQSKSGDAMYCTACCFRTGSSARKLKGRRYTDSYVLSSTLWNAMPTKLC